MHNSVKSTKPVVCYKVENFHHSIKTFMKVRELILTKVSDDESDWKNVQKNRYSRKHGL